MFVKLSSMFIHFSCKIYGSKLIQCQKSECKYIIESFEVKKSKRSIAVSDSPHRYGNSHAMGSHSITCHPAEVTFPPLPQPKLVLD